jgi:DNA-binding CsgD family transcriptional regulator
VVDLAGQISHLRPALQRLVDQDLRGSVQAASSSPDDAVTDGPGGGSRGRSPQRRLKADEIDRMVVAYEGGMTCREVAAVFGVHRATVSGHLKRRGISLRGQGLHEDAIPEAMRLYEEGTSSWDLGEMFGVSPQTVLSALRREGVEVRPAGFGTRTQVPASAVPM